MFIETICETNQCVGCSNCKNVCPVNAITMEYDSKGFLHPQIDKRVCVGCKKCEYSCPRHGLQYQEMEQLPVAWIVQARNEEKVRDGASGGLCTLLSEYFVRDMGGFVCGAVYDQEFKVKHIVTNEEGEIQRMRHSKYVQSDLGNCFAVIEEKLKSGTWVLMIGMGCQVYALKKYLKTEYPNLFCIDLVCHGAPSPAVQNEYIRYLRERYGNLTWMNNRNKKFYPHSYVSTYAAEFESQRKIVNRYSDDPMATAFFSHLSIRNTCFDCPFKTVHRISDLTVGDFWFSEMFGFGEDRLGVNLCLLQSPKGEKLLEQISSLIKKEEIDSQTAIVLNGGMIYSSCKENKKRQEFFDHLGHEPFDQLVFRLAGYTIRTRMKNRLREIAAPLIRRTKYYNKQLKGSMKSRLKREIPKNKNGLLHY